MAKQIPPRPGAPHSVDPEFLSLMERHQGIVEQELFDCLGRPVFFEKAVKLVLARVADRIRESTSGMESEDPRLLALAKFEAKILSRQVERGFVRTARLCLEGGC
jgi:hypothetical protein